MVLPRHHDQHARPHRCVVQLPVHREPLGDRRERGPDAGEVDVVVHRAEHDAHEEAAGVDVVVLRALEDVAAALREERRHRGDDAGTVGAGQREDGSHRVRPAVTRGWEVGIGCGGPRQRHSSRVACRSTWSVGSASQKARSPAVRERAAQPAVAMRTRLRNIAFMSQRQAAQELPTSSAPNGPAGGFVGEPTFGPEAVGQASFALGHPRCPASLFTAGIGAKRTSGYPHPEQTPTIYSRSTPGCAETSLFAADQASGISCPRTRAYCAMRECFRHGASGGRRQPTARALSQDPFGNSGVAPEAVRRPAS